MKLGGGGGRQDLGFLFILTYFNIYFFGRVLLHTINFERYFWIMGCVFVQAVFTAYAKIYIFSNSFWNAIQFFL